MPHLKSLISAALGAFLASSSFAATEVEIIRTSGGSIKTVLSNTIAVNENSSMTREWIVVKQIDFPVKLIGTPGVKTGYSDGGRFSTAGYNYRSEFALEVSEPVVAVEIRFLTFNIWGERGVTLELTKVMDLAPGTRNFEGSWRAGSENEVSEYYASIGYVARVRTKSGKVVETDSAPVIAEARKLYAKFAEADLEPEKPGRPEKVGK
jgi:hypothetical protein